MKAIRHAMVTHLGVGDGIIQAGLAVALLERYESIGFPCYTGNLATFESIFANHPRITVYPVPLKAGEPWGSPPDATYDQAIKDAGLNPHYQIRLGIYSGRGIGWDFSKDFYHHAGLEYEIRWRLCPIREAWQAVSQVDSEPLNPSRRIFVHDDKTRGFVINRRRAGKGFVLSPNGELNKSILRYAGYLIAADEVHCIDSAFFWLADHLPTTGRLYLHRYARWQRPRSFSYETFRHWNQID